jgi:hypothetical protein
VTPKELDQSYNEKKTLFHTYVDNIKQNAAWDIYTVINATLIKNPFTSTFPKRFFANANIKKYKFLSFLKNAALFYIRNFYLFISYFIAFILYNLYYKKQRKNRLKIIIDIFGLVDKVNKENLFNETYFSGVYDIFEQCGKEYCILIRPYEVGRNPFKLIKFFKIISHDARDFIFEYEFLTFNNFITLFGLILIYPFKTLRLLRQEQSATDTLFNQALLNDIKLFGFDAFTRYLFGKNLAKIKTIRTIFSWSEFQVIERSFNFGIRQNNTHIKIIGCQFFINYETYFNAYIDDLDYEMLSSPHKVLVNGKYYVLERQKVIYSTGVSLRYKSVFNFSGIKTEKNILLLGSYIEEDTQYLLESVKLFETVLFKNHPTVDINRFGTLPNNITLANENIYALFENTKIVIGTASGSLLEAVACGISCIVIASQDNLTANPLVEYGKGEIWDIAFSKDDVTELYNKITQFRKNNISKINEIAAWYKDNFFIEPTEANMINAFDLKQE